MAYLGERMYSCFSTLFNWTQTHIVVVSGSGPNACGHTILNAGQFYFHIDGFREYPWYFSESGYRRYLKENGKKELFRRRVRVTNPSRAQEKLEELSADKWTWGGAVHNCVTYVEEILKAGGSDESLFSNCPVRWK
ncbi:hypothetical protein [Chitinivorax sp. B]|uniref:hypothetical protein n=1 Tax=Chitinivorax sp. B TaxID=2502235 RepID=UPI0010F9D5EE|nr:hypothetical protein [Chitinivorax sp. B]